jgi:glutamate-5-semialdehyde dehydrogenase
MAQDDSEDVVMATALRHDLEAAMDQLGHSARAAARALATVPREAKDQALRAAADALRAQRTTILEANARDVGAARERGLRPALLDRLTLDRAAIEAMAAGLETVAALDDPIGQEIARWQRPNGLDIARVRVPLGVVGIIYESRPNVTADAGALCLKAGNAQLTEVCNLMIRLLGTVGEGARERHSEQAHYDQQQV